MATRMIKEDRALRADRQRRAEESRKYLVRDFRGLGDTVDYELRDRMRTIHTNAAALERQNRELKAKTAALNKQTRQWAGMADNARGRLKELGDVQNWAEMIEHDLALIEETLKIAQDEHCGLNGNGQAHSNGRK